jgi:hypothetical protein
MVNRQKPQGISLQEEDRLIRAWQNGEKSSESAQRLRRHIQSELGTWMSRLWDRYKAANVLMMEDVQDDAFERMCMMKKWAPLDSPRPRIHLWAIQFFYTSLWGKLRQHGQSPEGIEEDLTPATKSGDSGLSEEDRRSLDKSLGGYFGAIEKRKEWEAGEEKACLELKLRWKVSDGKAMPLHYPKRTNDHIGLYLRQARNWNITTDGVFRLLTSGVRRLMETSAGKALETGPQKVLLALAPPWTTIEGLKDEVSRLWDDPLHGAWVRTALLRKASSLLDDRDSSCRRFLAERATAELGVSAPWLEGWVSPVIDLMPPETWKEPSRIWPAFLERFRHDIVGAVAAGESSQVSPFSAEAVRVAEICALGVGSERVGDMEDVLGMSAPLLEKPEMSFLAVLRDWSELHGRLMKGRIGMTPAGD